MSSSVAGFTRFRPSKRISATGAGAGGSAGPCFARSSAYAAGASERADSRGAALRAAASPAGTAFGRWSKSAAEKAPSSGSIRMSEGLSDASDARTFCSVRMLMNCSVMPTTDPSCSRLSSGVPRFTAITMSAPIARATSTGRLSVSPPSTSSMPPTCAGAIAAGTDMLARIACASSPSSITTAFPVTRSVATARNGIGSASNPPGPEAFARRRSTVSSWMPLTAPLGSSTWPSLTPSSSSNRIVRSSSLRRIVWSCRGGLSWKRSFLVIVAISASISAIDMPLA